MNILKENLNQWKVQNEELSKRDFDLAHDDNKSDLLRKKNIEKSKMEIAKDIINQIKSIKELQQSKIEETKGSV